MPKKRALKKLARIRLVVALILTTLSCGVLVEFVAVRLAAQQSPNNLAINSAQAMRESSEIVAATKSYTQEKINAELADVTDHGQDSLAGTAPMYTNLASAPSAADVDQNLPIAFANGVSHPAPQQAKTTGPQKSGAAPISVSAETTAVANGSNAGRAPNVQGGGLIDQFGNQIIAFYGKPGARQMGILGQYSKEDLMPKIKSYAAMYDSVNGAQGVTPAFYLIYATCWPGGEIGYLSKDVIISYIEYAQANGMLVFLDHQLGKYDVGDSVRKMLPYLKYPNVHLAIDPEWHTTQPMKEIGSITADELNQAQAIMNEYMISENIPGKRMLVVHQFNHDMIQQRDTVQSNYSRVNLIHTADGFGNPRLKKGTYVMNAKADNIPLKGFKLFFKSGFEGAGYDDPLMKPEEVLALKPKPVLVMYQ